MQKKRWNIWVDMGYRTLNVTPTEFHIEIYGLCLDSVGRLDSILVFYSMINSSYMLPSLLFLHNFQASPIDPIQVM